jgi:hypothetical protein
MSRFTVVEGEVQLADGTTPTQKLEVDSSKRAKIDIAGWFGSLFPTVGQKLKAQCIPVVLPEDQASIGIFVSVPPGSARGINTGTIQLGGGTQFTINAIRATPYTEPSAQAQRSVASNNAADTLLGTGARKIKITYYESALVGDTGGVPFTEIINLNGTTFVPTAASDLRFIEKMEVIENGSSLGNVGTISLFVNNTGGGGTLGTIGVGNLVAAVGDRQTLWAHHYVPVARSVTLPTYVVSAESGGSGTNATFFIRKRLPLTPDATELIISDLLLAVGSIVRILNAPIVVDGPAIVTAYGVPAVNNAKLTAAFDWSEGDTPPP